MHERQAFLVFTVLARVSARFFLVMLHFSRLPGPLPGAASAVPASYRGGVCKIETRALSPRWHRLLITAPSVSKILLSYRTTRSAHL